jgi:uncharacterized protein HemY
MVISELNTIIEMKAHMVNILYIITAIIILIPVISAIVISWERDRKYIKVSKDILSRRVENNEGLDGYAQEIIGAIKQSYPPDHIPNKWRVH